MSIQSLGKQSLIYGTGHILTRLASFLLLPLLTNSLTTEDYGIISILYIFIGFSMTLYRYGMDTALMKFYIQSEDPKAYFSSIILLQFFTSLVFSSILFLLRYYIEPILIGNGNTILISYIAIIIFCDIIWNLIVIVLRTSNKAFQFISFNILNVLIMLGSTIYLVNVCNLGIEGVLLGNVIPSIIMLISACTLLINRFSIRKISLTIIIKIVRFGLPFLPAAIFTIIMEGADRFILKTMLDESMVGIYSAGYKLGIFGLLIIMGFNMGWTPYFLKHNNDDDANANYSTISTILLGIYGFMGILLTIVIPQIKYYSIYGYTLIGSDYFGGLSIVPIILLSYYFFGIYVLMMPRIYKYEHTKKIVSFRFIGALSNVIMNIILIPKFGIIGSAYATLVSFIIMSFYIFIVGNRLEYIKYNIKGWLFPFITWVLALISIYLTNNYAIAILIVCSYPILWYKIIITTEEKEKIVRIIQ
tara:strand:+ start:6137 stop:7558 length:1422 start_codon:yes stop_codon:yes gene_type:complete